MYGVLIGLTEIGEVHAYIMDEGEKIPQEGRLSTAAFDINDLVKGLQEEAKHGFEEACFLFLFGQLPTAEQPKYLEVIEESRNLPMGLQKI